ncbi:cytochrome C [Desulfuromonas acetoxidans]|uniref:Cytochrome c family protein n=1 Tax=Desulfuromonas acetoxidans (strain DSM 684 / 11070) TaxID=281689 RepID=Q1JVM4_DESA6|nr:selenite/tellurite reduction operon b-type cytochrome iron-sulfur cluster-binding subunit ExtO [Desulfuromonas acetoxidans]EAT14297.1 cytochrome c family protein [Desulfuromonas acetoxidans DSM 684]MBF0646220.1 cytochrome C [Desulfuromonas acetoxidans]NVD25064.1 cytochrome C [Desulfuromonas acetoxidans]NVE17109.1 cytochrome C [Desulfuromonas acetoxidans]
MTRLTVAFSALLLIVSVTPVLAAPCQQCHEVTVSGVHQGIACQECHGAQGNLGNPGIADNRGLGCVECHADTGMIFSHAMSRRTAEQEFCQRSWGRADTTFYATNCQQCHVASCADCHGSGHAMTTPDTHRCQTCHQGYFVGWDFSGRAPREDSVRYQRGPRSHDQYYLKMRPDVHAEAGLDCSDCHTMASFLDGKVSAKSCRDCHDVNPDIIEHGIAAHLENMECVSCHASWAAQEYATYYVETINSSNRAYFRVKPTGNERYVKSSYLKRQDLPPLGVNEEGRVAPIRPQFQAYYSKVVDNQPQGEENQRLASEWKVFTPHTIRRGTALCDQCHGNARRFILEPLEQRIYRPDRDGLGIDSLWRAEGQRVVNGSFMPPARFERMSQKTPEYSRGYVKKWQDFLKKDAASSKP